MELVDRLYLKEHYNNYETSESGYLRNLDLSVMKSYEAIYRKYIDPNFILTIWCGNCRMDMVVRLYKYYNSLPIENLPEQRKEILIELTNDNFEEDSITTFITEEPKKKGHKSKKNG